jgi:hypothetical protein
MRFIANYFRHSPLRAREMHAAVSYPFPSFQDARDASVEVT